MVRTGVNYPKLVVVLLHSTDLLLQLLSRLSIYPREMSQSDCRYHDQIVDRFQPYTTRKNVYKLLIT